MDNQVDKYSFITVIKIGINTHQMMIPPDFMKHCDEDFSTNVILIGPSGEPCRVTIFEKDGIYMQDGWPRFLRNNLVKENELLLFTYEGDNCFRVQIFGLNGCERLNTKIAPQKSSAAKVHSSFFTVFIPQFCYDRMPIPRDFMKLARLDERVPKEIILRNSSEVDWNVRARCVFGNIYFVDGWKQFVADNCLEEEDFIFFKHDGKDQMKFKILKLYELEQIEVNQDEWVLEKQDDETEEHIGGNHHRAGKRKTARSSASKNIENAKYVHYDNPHFTALWPKGRENELRVPKKLIDDFSLNLPQNITFLCCEDFHKRDHCLLLQHDGRNDAPHIQTLPEETHVRKNRRTATGELLKWKDGRILYTGWARFCRMNNIDKKKDECICEFVMGEDQQIQMIQVHVVKNGLLMSAT
ncbi:unnamed protein product [Lupinus luteus]|uniref:TF-B3 domain-containing protein n=1 Tax=Lupinus luteus TaxID=3873 RepID=A0AAV1Y5F4_LUPLU